MSQISDAFDRIWSVWSPDGRKRSASKAKCREALKRAARKHPVEQIEAAAKAYASQTKGEFHKGLNRWLADGRYEHFAEESAGPVEITLDQWRNAMANFCDSGVWDLAFASPPPDQPGTKVPAGLLAHALKRLPATDERRLGISNNLQPRSAA